MTRHSSTSGLPDIATPGVMVTKPGTDAVGITTEHIKRGGPWKGRVTVMWRGMGYEVAEWPDDLERLEL